MPTLVQYVAGTPVSFNSGTSGTASVTIAAAGAGNCLVARISVIGSNGGPSVTTVKTGSSTENWAKGVEVDDAGNTACAAVWVDPDTAGGGTTVAVTVAFGATASSTNTVTLIVEVMEWSGVVSTSPVDKTSTGATGQTASPWSSGATATTSQASEVAIGVMNVASQSGGALTVTGPGSPWTNESVISSTVVYGGTTYDCYSLGGYQVLSSTGTVTYSGTISAAGYWDAVVLTLKGTSSVTSSGGVSLGSAEASGTGTVADPVTATGSASLASAEASGTGTVANPVTASGSAGLASMEAAGTVAVPAQPFPSAPLDLRCELDLGTLGWTDVSSDVYQRDGNSPPVTLTRGRQDESTKANPGTGTWEWNNRSGKYSPKNPLSPYYGLLGRNTPVRWSVPAQSSYMRMEDDGSSGATCPDASGLHITGDLDIRADVLLTDWQAHGIVNRWATGSQSWLLELNANGTLQFYWSTTGSDYPSAASTVAPPAGRLTLRVTLQVSTGTVTFYTGPAGNADSSTGWTQLGSQVVTGATSVYAGTAEIAAGGFYGSFFELEVRSGIGGTVVAHPVFSAQSAGAASFADAQGNTWTLDGTAEISTRSYRFHGQMSAQPPKWDVTGNDMAVAAQAGGLLRLIGQGQAPEMSPMKRAVLLQPGTLAPVAYWPCEDAAGATALGSATGGPLMSITGSPQLANSSVFLCSSALPALNGSQWFGAVPAYTSNGSIVVRFLLDLGTIPSATGYAVVRVITTGTCQEFSLQVPANNSLRLIGYSAAGATVFSDTAVFSNMPNAVWVSMELTPGSGSTVNYQVVAMVPGATTGQASSGTFSGTIGNATGIYVNPGGPWTDTVIGQIQVQSAWVSMYTLTQPLNGWTGETAATRFARLAGENGYAARIIGPPLDSALMGAQAVDTLSNLLQACEDADRGQIFEPRQALALGYRTLGSMCNQAAQLVLDYSQSEPGGADGSEQSSGLEPTYDDQLTRNDWTLTRSAGSGADGATYQYQLNDGSAMSIANPPTGVGDYADTLSVDVQYDEQLPDVAGWMVHIGTVDEARWPGIPLNLARPQMQSLYWDALEADIGDYLQIINAPDLVVYDPVEQLAWQVTEKLGGFHYAMEFSAVPERPYETAVFDDPVYGHADTDGSELYANYTYGAATLQVSTTGPSGILWTTDSADLPFDINISGMRLTVTNITGSSSPQTFYVTPGVNGVQKNLTAGADVRLWFAPILALA